jgi:hypothetical protein
MGNAECGIEIRRTKTRSETALEQFREIENIIGADL